MTAEDDDQVNETLVRFLVGGKIVALRGGVFELPVVGHSRLQSLVKSAAGA
jgi:hypothetical protein